MGLPISENPTNTGLLVASLTADNEVREKLENSKLAVQKVLPAKLSKGVDFPVISKIIGFLPNNREFSYN